MLTWSHMMYDVPLPRPIRTAHGTYDRRAGMIIRADAGNGFVGIGDVAPLPGFSHETLADAIGQWDTIRPQLAGSAPPTDVGGLKETVEALDGGDDLYPSMRFGLELALADIAARRESLPLCRWLDPGCGFDIAVNALLHQHDITELTNTLRQRMTEGYRCFKVKVGVGEVAYDIDRVRAMRDVSPDIRIRADVNAGWTSDQLEQFCRGCQTLALEFIEQPLPIGSVTTARQITREFGFKLALDEEIGSVDDAEKVIADVLCDVVVLKPMMIGGLSPCLQVARIAAKTGCRMVLTSSWESDVGIAATAHLAAACGHTAADSGLSTAGMIAVGIVDVPMRIALGTIHVPDRPGLGLCLADDAGRRS